MKSPPFRHHDGTGQAATSPRPTTSPTLTCRDPFARADSRALLLPVLALTTVGVVLGAMFDASVGLGGVIAGTVAMLAEAVAITALVLRDRS